MVRDDSTLPHDGAATLPVESDALFALLYDDLRVTAQRLFRTASPGTDLQATALLHEAWLRLGPNSGQRFEARRAFVVAVTKTMRSILVDHARHKSRLKCGGDRAREPLDEVLAIYESAGTDVIDLCDALEALAELDQGLAELAELHLVAGLALVEIASLREESPNEVRRDWETCRRWLARRIGQGDAQ